ncbi:MAG: hypothetical protein AAF368_09440, partial [Planctomycetota bacterium]
TTSPAQSAVALPYRALRSALLVLLPFVSTASAAAQEAWSELWVRASEGSGNWRPTAQNSALGYYGTQVMTQVGPFTDYTQLLSSFDNSDVSPVWEKIETLETRNHRVAAAETAPVYATLHSRPTSDPFGRRDVLLRTFHPTSPAPQNEFALPVETNGHEKLFLETARDGSLVVAAIYDTFAFQQNLPDTLIALVDPETGSLQLDRVNIFFGGFNHAALSSDGRRLLLSTSTQFVVYDTVLRQTLITQGHPFGFQPAGCALSRDGSTVIHFGSQVNGDVLEASLRVYVEVPGTPTFAFDQEFREPAATRCSVATVSEDGLLIASGLDFASYGRVLLQGHRIQGPNRTPQLAFGRNFFTSSSYQLYASAVDLSEDDQTAVFGLSGDSGGSEPELVLFDTDSSLPRATFSLRGSVFSAEMVNGFLLVANKSVHFGEFAGGGDFRLFGAPSDLRFRGGKPVPGATLQAETRDALPTSFARVVFAGRLGSAPWEVGLIGTLYPERQSLFSRPIGSVDAEGCSVGTFTLGQLVGEVRYAQGLHTGPARRLTRRWLPVMTLP